jgi:hypothetical protein
MPLAGFGHPGDVLAQQIKLKLQLLIPLARCQS